ncbi:hypothetical protein Pla110_18210 [Polystyrenella longa]|uniref:DUF2262 domain-containing protein n=1 Tax=Polystyrenella longa TaxID=2528007 RepID=A0A518CLJ4_9PLAN|nr:hypothetical protein [Polystyrenella longa]QDU80099.1 hypothetical protein Pla110_18210 [Polystyrenella longa]
MKRYQDLTARDFMFEDSPWGEKCFANVECNGQEVSIRIPRREFANEQVVKLCKDALAVWLKDGKKIAHLTQQYLGLCMSGVEVQPEERSLWSVLVNELDGYPTPMEHIGKPCSITFMYELTGDYTDSDSENDYFNEESTIELMLNVNDYNIDWDNSDFDITTDFA